LKRAKCPACERPEKVCLCPWLEKVDNKFPIIVLRHKSEAGHALNTVNILKKSLENITVYDGETFSPEIIPKKSFLIYPGEDSQSFKESPLDQKSTLVLLDGSWKKTRKIIYLNPWLEELPKVSLPFQSSRYFLRKQREDGFSTLEAAHSALSYLEPKNNFEPLLNCLDKMMELQSKFIGAEKMSEHFGERMTKISSDKNDSKVEFLSDRSNPDGKTQHPKTQ